MKMSDNPVPSLILVEQASAPSQTPSGEYPGIPSGDDRLYLSSVDHGLYRVDSSGAPHRLGPEVDTLIGASAPGAPTHYLRISLDGGATWYRVALSPDS
jgi:hypothetical protein